MTYIALLAAAGVTPRTIDSLEPLTLDWSRAETVVHKSQIAGAQAFREQDDIIYDPVSGRFVFYVTVQFAGPQWETWVIYSTNGVQWGNPVRCVMDTGGPVLGQDPSVVMNFTDSTLHRDTGGRMWLYLENHPDPGNHSTHCYSSLDGETWTLEVENVIANGVGNEWDFLTGSPNARYLDGGTYVVGFEGFGNTAGTESWGVATGTDPRVLTKSPANPLIEGTQHGIGVSCFMDGWWLSKDGARVILTGHSGIDNGTFMPRFYTTNVDPLTWTAADFVLIGDTDDAVRNDLSAHVRGDRLVTSPAADTSVVVVPLA